MEKMKQLVDTLNEYGYKYYVLDQPIVADREYDKLYDELLSLEKSSGIVLPDSPTLKVGGDAIKGFNQHTHLSKLYSLDKCNNYDQLREWDAKIKKIFPEISYTLEYKLDGLTLCLTYNDGLLQKAATRGNGSVGEDVTVQVKTIKSVPSKIAYRGLVEAQGEGIMRWSAFKAYNLHANEPLKNPRNGVAGAIRNLDPKVTSSRNLDVVFYNINYIENNEITSQQGVENFLKTNHFKTEKLFVCNTIEAVINHIQSVDRDSLDFVIDGMVIKVNDIKVRQKLGYTDKFPRWAMAYKFEAEETTTILKQVIWQVGRTGKLTPLAILQPVELCGATISKATLNNYGDIVRKKVKIGAEVFLRRSGDVIPEILATVEGSGGEDIFAPDVCPACGASVVADGAHIFCSNANCPPRLCGAIEHFASKDCMDIEGVSEKTVLQLNQKLGVISALDLYGLTKQQLETVDGFKDKKVSNFLKNVLASKNADLPHFLNALGIPNIGKKTARDLSEVFLSIDGLIAATREQLLSVNEVGDIMADSIINYFKVNADIISGFRQIGINPVFKAATSEGYFNAKRVVITGTLSVPRANIAKQIEDQGGIVQSAVSSETDFLLAGESAGSKKEKAQKLGKKIIDEIEFNILLNS